MLEFVRKDWRGLLMLFSLVLCCATGRNDANIPVVEDVVAVASANPTKAVVYWKPLVDDRVAMYMVYYKSNASGSIEMRKEVLHLANSAAVGELMIGHHYTFTVSVGYVLDGGNITIGPRSEVTADTNITTGLTLNMQSMDDDNEGLIAVAFYGCLLVLSMAVNLVLLVMSSVLLKQLRAKCRMRISNTSIHNPIEMKIVRRGCDIDVPQKPAREHLPKEAFNEMFDRKCSPAKEAEVEEL